MKIKSSKTLSKVGKLFLNIPWDGSHHPYENTSCFPRGELGNAKSDMLNKSVIPFKALASRATFTTFRFTISDRITKKQMFPSWVGTPRVNRALLAGKTTLKKRGRVSPESFLLNLHRFKGVGGFAVIRIPLFNSLRAKLVQFMFNRS